MLLRQLLGQISSNLFLFFSKKDARGVITQSAITLGEWSNIPHYKDILSALFLQTGNAIVGVDTQTGLYEQRLLGGVAADTDELPTASALNFYTSFANQASPMFSWSRTLPSSFGYVPLG